MGTHDMVRRVQDEQAWTDATLVEVLLDYLSSQDDDAGLADFLAQHSAGLIQHGIAWGYTEAGGEPSP